MGLEGAGESVGGLIAGFEELGEAEVEDTRAGVVADDDVGGFEVAVHDASGVRGAKGVSDLDGEAQRFVHAHAVRGDELGEGLAGHVLHGDVVVPVRGSDVVDDDDVGVVESGGGFGFLGEAALALGVVHAVRREEFEGDEAVEVGVAGFVDNAHAALAEFFEDVVMGERGTGQRGRQTATTPPESLPAFHSARQTNLPATMVAAGPPVNVWLWKGELREREGDLLTS